MTYLKKLFQRLLCLSCQEMVDAVDGLPTDLAHDLFEETVPEITLLVPSRNG